MHAFEIKLRYPHLLCPRAVRVDLASNKVCVCYLTSAPLQPGGYEQPVSLTFSL